MTLTNEDVKLSLAKLLWQNGFGEDPWRNWRMAELMMIDEGFLAWQRQARRLTQDEASGATGAEHDQALSDFYNGISYWLYATSLGMSWPSHDPEVNWRIAEALKDWFAKVDF